MPETDVRDLLQAGLHFGHQTRRWNPRMGRYIWGERDGIHIIDLLQTQVLLDEARDFAAEVAAGGGTVLFVGTKKQASDGVKEWADKCGMPYVNQRWLGGLLTNFHTISKRIDRLHELDGLKNDGQLDLLPTKERMSMEAELEKLTYNLGGVRDMERLPDAIVIIDVKTEAIGLREAEILRIPIIALVDSNVDPGNVSYPIPGNDDAIRSCDLVIRTLGEAIRDFGLDVPRGRGQAQGRGRGAPPPRGGGAAQARGRGARAQGRRGGRREGGRGEGQGRRPSSRRRQRLRARRRARRRPRRRAPEQPKEEGRKWRTSQPRTSRTCASAPAPGSWTASPHWRRPRATSTARSRSCA